MAHHASARKCIRSSRSKRQKNRYQKKSCYTFIKKFVKTADKTKATSSLSQAESMLDKLAKRRILHKNKSARLKSQLARRTNAL